MAMIVIIDFSIARSMRESILNDFDKLRRRFEKEEERGSVLLQILISKRRKNFFFVVLNID